MTDSTITKIAERIKLIAFDNDGVLTDGHVWINRDGVDSKSYDVRDGLGIIMARKAGITIAIITGLKSPIVEKRAQQLGIDEVHQGLHDKNDIMKNLLIRYKLSSEEAAYMGDDIVDIPVFKTVALSAAPADAHPEVREKAVWVAKNSGGNGAVRELIDLIMKAQGTSGDFFRDE